MQKNIVFASVVSEISQSDIYMTVKARLFETPKANLNGVAVTSAFLDEIVENEDKYVGLPLCADVKNLMSGKYDRLGHLYDARTGEFHSTQIGSFYKFEKEEFKGGAYCVGYARVMKRYKKVCKAIAELFSEGALKFSFEVLCGEYTVQEDGTTLIDASDNNYLEGAAIVSFPACEDAVALDLVAEVTGIEDDMKRGEQEMLDQNETITAEETEQVAEVTEFVETAAEEQPVEQTAEENHEEVTAEEEVSAETEEQVSACDDTDDDHDDHENAEENTETAQVYQTERTEVTVSTDTYDSDTGESTTVVDAHTEIVHTTVPGEGGAIAAEETPSLAQVVAELSETVKQLKEQIASLQATHTVAESIPDHGNDINPFMGEINAQDDWRSLLEKEEPKDYHDLL